MNFSASEFLEKLQTIDSEKINNVKGIGEILTANFKDFTTSERYQLLINRFKDLELKEIRVNIKQSQIKNNNTYLPLLNERICITGTFEIPREEIKLKLESLGAKIVSDVSSKTSVLLCGQEAGSKLAKAQALKIKIITDLATLIG